MASLGDLLSGALGGEYSMGRPIDEEERRRIEELRAQGVYVPQERKISPFRYGAGTVSQRNLANIRGAIQPEQKRRLEEYLAQAGEQERQRVAEENRTRAMGFAVKDQARLADLKRRQGQPWTPDSGQSFKEHLQGGLAMPPLTDTERAELTVRQRGLLPYRQQEAALTKTEQDVATGAAKYPTTVAQEKDKQETLALTAKIRKLLSPEYATIMARNTKLGADLDSRILEAKLRVENSPAGQAIRQQVADNQLAQSMIDALTVEQFNRWLTGGSEDAQRFIDAGGQRGLDIADQFNTMQARLLQASRMGGLGGGLGGVLPPDFYGNQPRRQAGGRPTGVPYEADEELGGQPARLTPPVSGSSRPPTQTPRVPMRRGERRVRQTQPQTQPSRQTQPQQSIPAPVAPSLAPAQQQNFYLNTESPDKQRIRARLVDIEKEIRGIREENPAAARAGYTTAREKDLLALLQSLYRNNPWLSEQEQARRAMFEELNM